MPRKTRKSKVNLSSFLYRGFATLLVATGVIYLTVDYGLWAGPYLDFDSERFIFLTMVIGFPIAAIIAHWFYPKLRVRRIFAVFLLLSFALCAGRHSQALLFSHEMGFLTAVWILFSMAVIHAFIACCFLKNEPIFRFINRAPWFKRSHK